MIPLMLLTIIPTFTAIDPPQIDCYPTTTIYMDYYPVNPYNMPDIPATDEDGYVIQPEQVDE